MQQFQIIFSIFAPEEHTKDLMKFLQSSNFRYEAKANPYSHYCQKEVQRSQSKETWTAEKQIVKITELEVKSMKLKLHF